MPSANTPWVAAVRLSPIADELGSGSSPVVRQSRLSWPLSPVPVVTKYFDAPETPFGAGHRGVDLAAVPGQDVLAADAGVVVFAGMVGGRPVLSVDHDGGLRTTYEPVVPKVAVGEQVYRGQVLGTVLAGHLGCPTAACLHWGVRRGEEYVDPLALTGETGEYRLKPWGGGG
ncbi:peptidase [Amycolatopsis vancoresmycina DSM 44592]|uniref:Peptidase n=1 Tax=Amycolatopsis vancoresmycina DSM 44592 TaxID=1292037 RepID=R1GCT1_9PSEU|nr:peptidase [Amycolatopsis vancoresmycina DSM 44592]